MSISGGIKFFNTNQNLAVNGASGTATSGQSTMDQCLDLNTLTKWRSVSSDDTTTETLIITLPGATAIDRILLLDHNWKEYTVKYDSSGIFTDFTNVVGLDGSLGGGITETTFADTTSYYEFTEVTTTRLEITVTKTQVVDDDKYLAQLISTSELGTLDGYPLVRGMKAMRNARKRKVLSGKDLIQKSEESFRVSLDFKNFGNKFESDIDLVMDLFDRENNFLVWLCGGRRGENYFRIALRGFRLEDVYQMQVRSDYSLSYKDNVYVNAVNVRMDLTEAVDNG